MTNLLEPSITTTRARQLPDARSEATDAPPAVTREVRPPRPPSDRTAPAPRGPWPRDAKIVVMILAVAALLAVLGTFLATTGGDDTETDQAERIELLTAEQERLTTDLAAAEADVVTLTAARAELDERIIDLDARMATATADLTALTAERDGLLTERTELQASLVAAEAEVAELELRLDTATDATATLDERLAVLDVQVGYLQERARVAERERDALAALFPIRFESSLRGVDVTGDWKVSWDEAYCTGLPTCGTVPAFDRITITETPEGWLRAKVNGVFETGLFEVEGALYGVTTSTGQRTAHVGLTLYANGISVSEDGAHAIEDLGATYVVDAPATATAPAAIAVYSGRLTQVG
jgi:hypothetical protein